MKTKFKEEKILTSDICLSENFANNDFYLETYFNINKLNDFIDRKVEQFINFSDIDKRYEKEANFLTNWKVNRRKELFISIDQIINSGNVKNDKLIKLNKRIYRYFKYFDLIEEEDSDDKYEEIFNTLLQIPSEIYAFIKEDKSQQNGIFIKSKYCYDNKIPSPRTLEDGILLS